MLKMCIPLFKHSDFANPEECFDYYMNGSVKTFEEKIKSLVTVSVHGLPS